jgi:pilus assembly protein CpaB
VRAADLIGRVNGRGSATEAGAAATPKLRLRSESGTSPAPVRARKLLQPIPLVGIVLVLVALVGYIAVYSATTERTPVLVAAKELSAGTVLRSSDLRVAELAGDRALIAGLVPETGLSSVVGRRLTTSVPAGAPLAQGVVAERPAQSALTLAVPAARALDGALQPGDEVTVLATYGASSGDAVARAVARDLTVIAVGDPASLGDDVLPVTVALPDASLASTLALANDDARLSLLREGADDRAAPIPAARAPQR